EQADAQRNQRADEVLGRSDGDIGEVLTVLVDRVGVHLVQDLTEQIASPDDYRRPHDRQCSENDHDGRQSEHTGVLTVRERVGARLAVAYRGLRGGDVRRGIVAVQEVSRIAPRL